VDLLLVGSQLEKVSIMVRKVDAITLSIGLISVLLASTIGRCSRNAWSDRLLCRGAHVSN